ncbi:MaoC family dehydratase [Roseomonas sp. NAR14]|uniref:MaoC family dehydratase n=1 Tax=Roseomonas acroporae TaxID=2937791 RepID=A0A9X1Y2V0_9PROT|nr:MaoC family dehydratase [Roseomonas acroporae]MCK8782919.1 MaoC family dehydratase [Roseomonas acroporae]
MSDGNGERARLYLEDLAAGQVYRTGSLTVDAAAIKAFAAQFDPQPFHLDEAAGAASLFGGLAASGWHTAALSMRLMVDSGFRVAGGLIGAGGELSWPRPTRPGDTLRVEIEILEVRPSRSRPQQGLAKVRNTTLNQHGEAVQVFAATMVVPRRPAGGG